MFVPLVLPLQVTCVAMCVAFLALVFLLRRFAKRPYLCSLGLCVLATIPTLYLVGAIVDSMRYGEFHHADASRLNDGYVELPAEASNIVLHKYASGHELMFDIDRASLESWINEMEGRWSEFTDPSSFELETEADQLEFSSRFSRGGWKMPPDAVLYRGPRSGRGGGCDVWYCDASQIAFISAGYW